MMKKIYAKPCLRAERFVADAYCSACGPTEEDKGTLYAKCVGSDVTVKITHMTTTGDQWSGEADPGMSGVLYNVGGDNWVFTGSITTGHESSKQQGEFWPLDVAAKAQGKQPGDEYNGYIVCNHEMKASAAHHHLEYGRIVYINHS